MKVLGKVSSDSLICEISISELKFIFDYAYRSKEELELVNLKVGDSLDLSMGHNFRYEITTACKDMIDAHKSFEKATNTMRDFSTLVIKQSLGVKNGKSSI